MARDSKQSRSCSPYEAPIVTVMESPLPLNEALQRLFATPEIDLEVEDGGSLPVRLVSLDDNGATVTAPRLRIAAGATLLGRVIDADDRPWAISFAVERADFHSETLAEADLRAVRIGLDESRRSSVRKPAGGMAWLVAVNCQNVVDGDRVDGTMTDLSQTGVGFATQRLLRKGDRLIFRGRFFKEEIDAEVRIASVREASVPGRLIIGARFIDIDQENLDRVERILAGGEIQVSHTFDVSSLRGLAVAGESRDGDAPNWRKLFRRGS